MSLALLAWIVQLL